VTRVLGYQTFADPDTGGRELLVRHELGRFVIENTLPCERALEDGRLFTNGRSFFVAHRGRLREVR